jgi:aspartate-semialdehyde dehydrogenase
MSEKKTYNVGILGASGNVGRLMLSILAERKFPLKNLKLLGSNRSAGSKMLFNNKEHIVEETNTDSFKDLDLVLASAGSAITIKYKDDITKAGAYLIDNSSAFRMDAEVPLVVPEVNADALDATKKIIANPNCSTAPLVVILDILRKLYPLKRVLVSTYQSISGAGKDAMQELRDTSLLQLDNKDYEAKAINQKLAFNLIPQIDKFAEDGYTKEELKVTNETRKILNLPELPVACTAVRVPVMVSHSESVNVEFKDAYELSVIKQALINSNDIEFYDNEDYPMPLEVTGTDPTHVGRLRVDISNPNALNFWLVSDNLRKGAALNTIQIAESMIQQGII